MNPALPTAAVPAPAAPAVPTPADQYATLKSAVLGAQVNTTPGASPLGSFPELDKLYSTAPQVAQTQLDSTAPNYNTGVTVANQKAAADAASAAASQKLKDLQDPSKYTQVAKADGGYAFYDPLGNEISASQYASITNKSPADVLKNSQNPIDKAFVQDYNQLQSYIQNKQNSGTDPAAKAAAQATEAEVQKLYGVNLAKESPSQVIQTFQSAYPTVFGGTGKAPQGTNTLLPDAAYVKANANATGAGGIGY